MMKTILKIVCVLMLVVNIANAQKDNSVNLTEDNQAKGIQENNYITAIGQVIEADLEHDLDLAMLYLQIIDNNSNDLYLTATSDDDNFDKLPRVSTDLIGKTVKASYEKSVEREVVEYRPAQLPEGVANRGAEVDPTITVYTITGTQKFVSESVEGYEITFETKKGVEMTFLADEMVFNGHSPIDFDGKEIKVSYIEFEDFNLKSLEILD